MAVLDVELGELFPLKDAPGKLPVSVDVATVYRWMYAGKLKTVVLGGKRMTCVRWIREMVETETTARDGGRVHVETKPPGRPRGRKRLEEVSADLDRLLGKSRV